MEIINAALSLFLTLACAWAVMCPAIKDGIIIKIGLVAISLGSFGGFVAFVEHTPHAVDAIHTIIMGGLVVCLAGYALRVRKGHGRRLTDWIDTEYLA